VPSKNQLWITAFGDKKLVVVDLDSYTVLDTLAIGKNPDGLALSSDGARVFVSVADGDAIVAVDVENRTTTSQAIGEASIADANGKPLPASSPAGIALDPTGKLLYVARAADNAVSILDATTLETKGAIPVGWYPTSVAVTPERLVVLNGKGYGTGPITQYAYGEASGKEKMRGSISVVDLTSVDLAATSKQVESNVKRPSTLVDVDCPDFSIPKQQGASKSPIEHVVLIVRENKTYDCELGDLGQKEADGDPSLVLYGEDVTPNLHAMARQFAHHDNFYDDSETSTQGHLWLTASFVNDYMERTWLEDYRGNDGFGPDPALERGTPGFGTFFTHLIAHGVDFTDFGEVVGAIDPGVMEHVDMNFPGVFYNTNIKDEEKARYVAKRLVEDEVFPPFVFVVLPDDHTNGTTPGGLTPEAMVSDNDFATGLVVDAITHSKYWENTAIFVVEDDPQIGADHVDYHRSYCLVLSPWAKHGYVSHVNASYPSLFRTFELILDLPPMNRYDALATPLFDVFTNEKDTATFTALPRKVPDVMNPPGSATASFSESMDFRGPDRNPDLGALLWWARKGAPPAGSRLERELALGHAPRAASGEAELDRDEQLADITERWLDRYYATHPDLHPDLRPLPAPPKRKMAFDDAD
jgi:YVTN family beta-propeller protein